MKTNIIKKYPIIQFLIFCGVIFYHDLAFAEQKAQSIDASALLGKLRPFVELITSDEPFLKKVVSLVGGNPCTDEGNPPTCYDVDGFRVIYWLEPNISEPMTRSALFMISELNSGITFQNIISIFGHWKIVMPGSKIPHVEFLYTNPSNGRKAIVIADLYDPPENLKSPVLRISIQKR